MLVFVRAGILDSTDSQQVERAPVKREDERLHCHVKPVERIGDPEGGHEWLPDCKRLRRHFTGDDVQKGDDREADAKRDRMTDRLVLLAVQAHREEHGFQQREEDGFTDPTETEAGEGDAELRGAQVGIQMLQQMSCACRPAVTFINQRLELRGPQFHQSKLGGDKETVQKYEHHDGNRLPGNLHDEIPVHNRTSPKMTFTMSCRQMMPISFLRRSTTTAMRWPVFCISCRASSKRLLSSRNSAGVA